MTHDAAHLIPAEAPAGFHVVHPFAAQLGSPEGLQVLASTLSALQLPPIHSESTLCEFLRVYRSRVLVPSELPAIKSAYEFSFRGQARELIALDQAIQRATPGMPFAEASAIIGQTQLRRLKPMRGNRALTRYLEAIAKGDARGWHTIAYGLMQATFSMPLRQGLAHYSESTLRGFVEAASEPLRLSEPHQTRLIQEACLGLEAAVNELLGPPSLVVV